MSWPLLEPLFLVGSSWFPYRKYLYWRPTSPQEDLSWWIREMLAPMEWFSYCFSLSGEVPGWIVDRPYPHAVFKEKATGDLRLVGLTEDGVSFRRSSGGAPDLLLFSWFLDHELWRGRREMDLLLLSCIVSTTEFLQRFKAGASILPLFYLGPGLLPPSPSSQE
jgi:hypothetical protein